MYTNSGILVREEMPYTAKTPGANESFWETSKTHFRFFHKIFQEYFAAFHISGLAKQEDTEHLAKEALVNLNHIELQYVYRFACGLNKATAKIIFDLFTKNSKASRIFATLCLLETDSEDKYNEVREYCCSGLVVNHYDSKSLQTSTIQLLQVASHQKIPLPSLELSCCVKSVNLEQETLLLFSGLVISKLDTVEELTLTFTNCVDMAASLLVLFSRIPVLKAVRFKHSTLPRSFDDRCVLSDLESNQCEVSWKNLSLEGKLNLSTGRWENANGDEMTDEDYERMLEDQVAEISGHKSSTSDLLDVLEERGYIHAANISPLLKSLCELKMTDSVLEIAESYQNSIEGLINATTVGKLVEPLTKYKLVLAVAKVKEYQSMVDRSGEKKTTVPTLMFDKEKRQSYIENIIPGDKKLEFTQAVERSSALRDLCSTPLIFAFIVHNMASLKLDQIHMKSVGSIMEEMINIIFSQAGSECKESNMMKVEEHSERLSEIAFNGLCRGYQQLQWPKTFFDKSIPNMKQWLNSGLLILEEPLREGKDQQTIKRDATGSDAIRSKETFKQSNKFEQVIENETTTKRGKKSRIHARFEESFCREGVQHVTRRPPEELPKATCSSPFGSALP
ncbi:hypothetical protein BSL78_04139 [Apostichopus japonicus]|uniref:Uncharacterized protein n=1 Tax=Stichopus japonicus TaxID=307972 RepID=A0A2G8LF99_STIJA|nr:hypothetical protein BSL78_04139 [Apostichopus japonicus]